MCVFKFRLACQKFNWWLLGALRKPRARKLVGKVPVACLSGLPSNKEHCKTGRDTTTLHEVAGLHPPSFLPPSMHLAFSSATRLILASGEWHAYFLSLLIHVQYVTYACFFVPVLSRCCLEVRLSKKGDLVFFSSLVNWCIIGLEYRSLVLMLENTHMSCDSRLAFIKSRNWAHMVAEHVICMCSLTQKVRRGIACS